MLVSRRPQVRLASAGIALVVASAALIALGLHSVSSAAPRVGPLQPPVTATDAGLRASDLPVGLNRCEATGPMPQYLSALQARGSAAYELTAIEWGRLQKLGATSGWVSSYATDIADCSLRLGERQTPSAVSFSFRFNNASQAQAAFASGFMDLRPAAGATTPGLARGAQTSLGPNSWLFTQSSPGPPLLVAYWATRNLAVFVITENVPFDTGRQAVRNIDSRVR